MIFISAVALIAVASALLAAAILAYRFGALGAKGAEASWPTYALAAGVALLLAGVLIVVGVRRWHPRPKRP